ncbi:MAG: cytochrome b [Gammaproteobacteria bacterium WSBS_2016_MAG_OTU1]
MTIRNERDAYGGMAITLHWLLFILIAGLIISGKYSDTLTTKDAMLIGFHKQMGLAVFVLMSFRLLWRLINTSPLPLSENLVTRFLAFLVHWLLYVFVLMQAWIGIAMSHLSGHKVSFLNIIEVPDMTAAATNFLEYVPNALFTSPEAAMQMRELHELGATVLIVLIGLHFLGAITNHVLFGNDTLRRMFYNYVPAYAKVKGGMEMPNKKKGK